MIFVNGFSHSLSSAKYHGLGPEYSILTCKNSATIAHEFLHLFGAIDLYPNEIMRITHKNIDKLMLSPLPNIILVGKTHWINLTLDCCIIKQEWLNIKY
jgi:hypothetical protein